MKLTRNFLIFESLKKKQNKTKINNTSLIDRQTEFLV